jgi:hypothetical protein
MAVARYLMECTHKPELFLHGYSLDNLDIGEEHGGGARATLWGSKVVVVFSDNVRRFEDACPQLLLYPAAAGALYTCDKPSNEQRGRTPAR